ncbi:MAG: hypothetical protein CL878_00555 [Dehalococcoidia bacterium]|nr:hypothetical protein [Dehalococcoidia bacterium]
MDDSATRTARLLGDRYELDERIGAGSVTEVFRATDHTEHRTVAVKLLRRHLADSESVRARFQQHAYLASRVTHDNIIPVYDLGEDQGQPYLVVEYLPGESLSEYVEHEAPLALDQALKLTHEIAVGVGHAHSRGLVHGDLRPHDVLFTTNRRPRVGDFGLVIATEGEQRQPEDAVARVPAYAAPEQLADEPSTSESDVYALGLILYELLTGRSPFHGATSASEEERFRPDPVWEFPAEVPPDIRRLVLGSAAADPQARFVDGIELAEAISEAIAEERRTRRFGSRHGPRAQRLEPESDYEPPVLAPRSAGLPSLGSAAGSGAMGTVLLALVFLAIIVVLAGAGLTFMRSFNPTLVAPAPFERPSPAVPTVAAPAATPSVPPIPTPSPTVALTGEEALVPQLVGLRLVQAEPWLKERRLPFAIKEEHSDQYEEGEIISQFPLALQALRQDEQVELVVSLGPRDREVPSVVNQPIADATKALEELKFSVEIEQAFSDTVAIGTVLTQVPEGGERAPSESSVRIVVSQGSQPATVPHLIGQNFRDARVTLGRLGLGAHVVEQPDATRAPGTVISQFPPGNSAVKKGSTVTLAVAAPTSQ